MAAGTHARGVHAAGGRIASAESACRAGKVHVHSKCPSSSVPCGAGRLLLVLCLDGRSAMRNPYPSGRFRGGREAAMHDRDVFGGIPLVRQGERQLVELTIFSIAY